MPPTLRSAIATTFAWTSSPPDIVLTFASGTSPVNVTIPSGSYRMLLAPSTSDFIRVVRAAINSAISGVGRSEVVTLAMGDDSKVVFTSTGALSASGDALNYLGFTVAISSATSATAAHPPRYFATFTSRASNGWVPRTAVASSETMAGVGYGVRINTWHDEDEVTFDFAPPDPSTRAALGVNQSPIYPDAIYSRAQYGAHAGQWSVVDLLASSLGKTCAAALGNFQDHLSSTSERYNLVTIPGAAIAQPRFERTREGWDAYYRWVTPLLRQSTATGTRA